MEKLLIYGALGLFALGVIAPQPVLAEDDQHSNDFTIQNAIIAGTGASNDPPITILLDRKTGQTWMLGQANGVIQWLQVPYSPVVPKNVVPPSLK